MKRVVKKKLSMSTNTIKSLEPAQVTGGGSKTLGTLFPTNCCSG